MMTEPREFTAAQAADPATPAAVLGEIATHRPDLRAAVASNPAAYPDLLAWLATFRDPAVDSALAARGGRSDEQRFSQPAAQSQPQPGAAWAPQGASSSQPTAAYGAPGGYGGSGQLAQGGYGQSQPGAYGHGGAAAHWSAPGQAKKSRRGLWIGLGVAGVLAVGGGAFAANSLWFSKVGGAASPEDAVVQLIEGAADKDLVSVYGVVSPAEVETMALGLDLFSRHMPDVDDADPKDTLEAYLDAFDLELSDLEVEVEAIEDGLAKVSITDGSLTIDADAEVLGDAVVDTSDDLRESRFWDLVEDESDEIPSDDEIRENVATSVDETFPVTVTHEDLVLDTSQVAFDVEIPTTGEPIPPFLMVVEEDGDWYVSPSLTVLEYGMISQGGERGSLPSDDLEGAFDSPEAAAEGLVEGLKEYWATGNMDDYLKALPLADRRAASLYGTDSLDADDAEELREVMELLEIDAAFTSRDEEDGVAWLMLESLTVSGEVDGDSGSFTLDSECFTADFDGETAEGCLDDIPALVELGIGDLSLIAVEDDGGWYVSAVGTLGDGGGILTSNLLRLYDEGKLTDEQWWEDNLGDLADLL